MVDNYKIGRMGGFRSQPLTVKDTELKELAGLTYAVSSMCGKDWPTQDGGSTWRTHTSARLFPTRRPISSQSSMDTEVPQVLCSGAEVSTFVKRHFVE